MADASLWDDVAPKFQRFGAVFRPDIVPGRSIEEMACIALAVASDAFVAIGFSMGGYVVREMARRAPRRVRGLVLVATSARSDTEERTRRMALAAGRIRQSGFGGLSPRTVAESLHPDHAANVAMIERVQAMSRNVGGDGFVRQASMTRAGDGDRLAEIGCPTLVIAAAHDSLRSIEESIELQRGIASAQLRVVERSGHMVPIEAPDELAAIISSWLVETGLAA